MCEPRRRLLLCLNGLGTNAGLKRMDAAQHGATYKDLLYARRRYVTVEQLREAVATVANGTLRARDPLIWGEGTNACASDSKHFGAWDQNLTTQWHVRYGGRGVMIYWHVERKSLCIHSQLKSPSSSEVASMIEGVMRHCTELEVDRQYVDSHGQSVVAFAFTKLLGFQLLPRLKAIHSQRLYRPETGHPDAYPNLQLVLSRPIDWELIRRQYDEMVKYATALRLGTAEAEAILRRFTRENVQHPTYKALAELGKAVKTVFLARYLHDQALRREINDGLNVVEHWNSANDFIFFARRGEFSSNRREDQEVSMLSLHLLQNCMVYINTLMVQQVLARPEWEGAPHPTRPARAHAAVLGPREPLRPLQSRHVHPHRRPCLTRSGPWWRKCWVGAIRDWMPDQHRLFFAQLPILFAAVADEAGWPMATALAGPPGFVSSPDSRTLHIAALPSWDDPAGAGLRAGALAGLLGIDLGTRRRNRANGTVLAVDGHGFTVGVRQSFGNCPQYIQAREVEAGKAPSPAGAAEHLGGLDPQARALIAGADTFFVASGSSTDGGDEGGLDMSHRGGRPGFVRVDGDVLTIPDFRGNRYFNTLGNLLLDPRAGLLFVDFAGGGLLHLQGRAELDWDGGAASGFAGAERLWRVRVTAGWRRPGALAVQWTFRGYAPTTECTGGWNTPDDG